MVGGEIVMVMMMMIFSSCLTVFLSTWITWRWWCLWESGSSENFSCGVFPSVLFRVFYLVNRELRENFCFQSFCRFLSVLSSYFSLLFSFTRWVNVRLENSDECLLNDYVYLGNISIEKCLFSVAFSQVVILLFDCFLWNNDKFQIHFSVILHCSSIFIYKDNFQSSSSFRQKVAIIVRKGHTYISINCRRQLRDVSSSHGIISINITFACFDKD